ncbi:MAG TPA: L-histidine N(alpha)-methyltransferase [Terriglobales bacterium]|jgi:dimethylhistidine N-methyltransferase
MIAREILPQIGLAADVAGLFERPKSLPPKLFYDAEGSALFERITQLPEYYPTRIEAAILRDNADEIAAAVQPLQSLIELGAGTSSKTRVLIAAFLRAQSKLKFFPVDISAAPLHLVRDAMRREFPGLEHTPIVTDFSDDLRLPGNIPATRLVLYLGSSIGNFEPMQAVAFLLRVRRTLCPGDALLLGADMRKHPRVLLPAYDDAEGVTGAFNKNILAHINRELGGHFDLRTFQHVVRWNSNESRIEMYLESAVRQTVLIESLEASVEFEAGELIHTENSYKYSDGMVRSMLRQAGFTVEKVWKDKRGWFSDYLARVPR